MYKKAYGIIKTLAPIHVGATAGEESGNLNLIFRDQFTQTGIIPGSSIRGRLRSEMRLESEKTEADVNHWYGTPADSQTPEHTTESLLKFEYASIIWLPVFCPGQPIVWVTCPRLLKRYQRITGKKVQTKEGRTLDKIPKYSASNALNKVISVGNQQKLFFNFGLITIQAKFDFSPLFTDGEERPAVIVGDEEMATIHDMALYRQSRVRLKDDEKTVDEGGFFNTEALPEETIMIFPIAIKPQKEERMWQPFGSSNTGEIYLGGLESIGFGHCEITIKEVQS